MIRIGIAGMGGIAKRTHLPVLQLLPEFTVVCGAEKDPVQRSRVAKLFNLKETFEDFRDMIAQAEIDAVFVCLPATLHYSAVSSALEKGLHVFCEKPMGISSEEAEAMVNLAKEKGKILMPGYNLRHVDNFVRAKKLINTGKLGKILHVNALFMNPGPYLSWDPKSDWYLDGASRGALYDIGSHLVDLLFHLYPHRIKRLYSYSSKGYLPYEALTNISCCYEGEEGLLGTIQVGWKTASEFCNIELHGTAGTLLVNRRNFVYTHGATDPADRVFTSVNNISKELSTVCRKLNLIRKGADVLEEFRQQAKEFYDLVTHKGLCLSKAEEAAYVHKVLESILIAVSEGREITMGAKMTIQSLPLS